MTALCGAGNRTHMSWDWGMSLPLHLAKQFRGVYTPKQTYKSILAFDVVFFQFSYFSGHEIVFRYSFASYFPGDL